MFSFYAVYMLIIMILFKMVRKTFFRTITDVKTIAVGETDLAQIQI